MLIYSWGPGVLLRINGVGWAAPSNIEEQVARGFRRKDIFVSFRLFSYPGSGQADGCHSII